MATMRKLTATIFTLMTLAVASVGASAQDVPVGEYRSTATVAELVGEETARYFASVIASDVQIEWDIYVPEGYDPEVPAGLVVYISPGDSGDIPNRWKSVLDERNLIWIAANQSGNSVDGGLRITYAVLAPTLASKTYRIDKSRVYVSGLSGGGRVASIVAPEYAHVFKGAVYNCGVNFWGKREPKRLSQIQANRYVFVTGNDDFNRRETKDAYSSYKKAGVAGVKLLDIPGMGHENPNGANFGKAIDFLDGQD
jgi:dienelactone hydrolase